MIYQDKNTTYQVTQFGTDQVIMQIIKSNDLGDLGAGGVFQACSLVEPLRSLVLTEFNI